MRIRFKSGYSSVIRSDQIRYWFPLKISNNFIFLNDFIDFFLYIFMNNLYKNSYLSLFVHKKVEEINHILNLVNFYISNWNTFLKLNCIHLVFKVWKLNFQSSLLFPDDEFVIFCGKELWKITFNITVYFTFTPVFILISP